jgi:hypothetical protein
MSKVEYIMGLDVSTKVIGVALFENKGDHGELKLLHHVAPKIKSKKLTKIEELCQKVSIFENEFLSKYKDFGITRVIIEEPLLRSNNVHTVGTLLRFNGMICRSVYETLGVSPDFISSYDSRAYAFPELMAKREFTKKGEPIPQKTIDKSKPVLFGAYPYDVDKKAVIWEKVADLEPKVAWLYDKRGFLRKENYDMSDSYSCVIGYMHKESLWSREQ